MINLSVHGALLRRRDDSMATHSLISRAAPRLSADFGPSNVVGSIVALIAISALFRLIMIGTQSLWLDEGVSLAMTDSKTVFGTFEAIWSVTGGDKYQPVYFILLAIWRALMGDSQITLQMLSVIFGVLTPALLYLGVKPLFGHRHAFISALFLACSAFCVSYSQEVRPYSFLLFMAVCQFLSFSPALNKQPGSRVRVLGFALITFLCCISSVFLLMFSVVMAISFLVCYRDFRLWLHWWGAALLAIVPALLYFAYTPAATDLATDAINTTNVAIWQNAVFALYGHVAGHTYGPAVSALRTTDDIRAELMGYLPALTILAVVFYILAVNTCRAIAGSLGNKRQASLQLYFALLLVLSLIVALAFAVITSLNWMPRHSFYLMVPFAVMLPLSLFHAPRNQHDSFWAQRMKQGSVVAFLGLILINLSANSNYYFDTDHWRDDYRSTAQFLNMHVDESDASIMLWGEPYLLEYYGHDAIKGLWRLEDAQEIYKTIATVVEENEHVFISINREHSWQRYSETLHRLLNESYELVPAAEFTNFTNYQLKPKVQAITST